MPRLEGKRSNTGIYIVSLFVLVVGVAVLIEYFGIVNLIPNFGRERDPAARLGAGLDIDKQTKPASC